ncbi:hypothetical protein [Oerskovia enterophila]|uniref:Uncharacterized protein n=1 Tax=Oerskovia enterophila TaxID=43678 RepID=A0A163R579_9CELL|nr:hypothetical protein [Oerskovia enterophila]KZM34872.1 hypothetical protein OJAG_24520 [Oerskovia enterophila]OCI31224.1 hypothetical protein OERS_20440 [Oerskovia enterophila]
MGKGARQEKSPCVFCGSDAKYSAEHVLAKHWRQLRGPERGPVFHRGFSRDPDGTIRTHDSVKEAKFFDMQAKSGICESCNTGWMSRLEVAVRPKLEHLAKPLAEGSFTFLTANTSARLELHRWG